MKNNGNLESSDSNIEIRFSSPESIGLCYIEIENEEITMTCQNKEKFSISKILIDRQAIQDSEGNEIFIVYSFTSPEQFACDISLNSVLTNVKMFQILIIRLNQFTHSTDKKGRGIFFKEKWR